MNLCREDLLLSLRAVLGRPAESLLLVLGMALAVGLALAGRIAEQSRVRLASPRYREIVVATRQQAADMEVPARPRSAADVVLTVDDLAARQMAPAVRYAYLANPTGFPLGELPIPQQVEMAVAGSPGRPSGAAGAGEAAAAVQVIVVPAGGQVDAPIADGARAPVAEAGAHAAQPPAPAAAPGDAPLLADGVRESSTAPGPTAVPGGGDAQPVADRGHGSSATPGPVAPEGGDAPLRFEKAAGLGQPLLTTPAGPRPQRELLTGFQVSPEFSPPGIWLPPPAACSPPPTWHVARRSWCSVPSSATRCSPTARPSTGRYSPSTVSTPSPGSWHRAAPRWTGTPLPRRPGRRSASRRAASVFRRTTPTCGSPWPTPAGSTRRGRSSPATSRPPTARARW